MGRRKHFKIFISKKEEKEREAVEERARELKKFFRGKRWNKKQREELEKQGKPPLILNRIKSGQELQREQMRGHMGLTSTEGMTITEENFKKLDSDLMKSRPAKDSCGVYLDNVLYEDFPHFCSALLEKYFTKEEIR